MSASAMAGDAPLVASVSFDELEYRWLGNADDPVAWSVAANVSRGRHSLSLVSEGDHTFGDLGGHELLVYYSYATPTDWNVNVGWRGDLKPSPQQDWTLFGVDGELPGQVAVAGTAYFAPGGDTAFRLEVERGLSLAPKWQLTPEVRADFFGQDMPESGRGSGLSTLEFALRLGYAWYDGFETYSGVVWGKAFGATGDFVASEGDDRITVQYVLGVSFAF